MLEELRKAIVNALKAALPPLVPAARVFDHVPQDFATYPYVTVAEGNTSPEDTDSTEGALCVFSVRAISAYKGGKQASAIVDAIRDALHHKESALAAFPMGDIITIFVSGTDYDPVTDDGKTRTAEVTVSVRVDDIISGTA